ncbi:hypothetical protein [Sphingomonas bacterium]|uniref:hypothetical protein n=1 Tax=Sphingomonas bacterium TaxID=1895847 RepID=UPI00260A66AF|nr:hypothetical protein [Sphingomonas bacterium]
MTATGERSWPMALLLALGAPVVLFVFNMATHNVRVPRELGPLLDAATVALMILGLHLLPLPWCARAIIAGVYLPVAVGLYVLALLTIGCMATGDCL